LPGIYTKLREFWI